MCPNDVKLVTANEVWLPNGKMQYSFYPKVLGVVIKENIKFVSSLQRRDEFDIFFKAADDDAGKLQSVFLKRLYLLHICIFSFFLFNASLTTI